MLFFHPAIFFEQAGFVKTFQELTLRCTEYSWISIRELAAYPDNHTGEKVIVQGYIFNIISDTKMQIMAGDYPTEPIFVFMAEPFSGIYENDYIRVYGIVNGKQCGANAFGGEICQPLLIDAFWEPREGAQ
jgi:hypothetical protein